MAKASFIRVAVIGAVVLVIAVGVYMFGLHRDRPATPTSDYDPASFVSKALPQQQQLTAPYVSSEYDIVRSMLDLAQTNANDYVADLGSGDGRIPIIAAREKGARGLGVDLDPERIRESIANASNAGVGDRVSFRQEDLFVTPLQDVTVLTLYLLPEINLQLRPRILSQMRPGARVVSNQFDMGDWRPDARRPGTGNTFIYLWIVPAQVAGRWQVTVGEAPPVALRLEQRFQEVTGTVTTGGGTKAISEARVQGTRIAFTADLGSGPRRFEGQIADGRMQGDGWQATRVGN